MNTFKKQVIKLPIYRVLGGQKIVEKYGYDDFLRMMDWMPNVVEIVFDGKEVVAINEIGHLE